MTNLKYYYLFYIFNGLSLAVCANPLFLDKVMLEMGISLSAFGWIKGISLLGGTMACVLTSHIVDNWDNEYKVVVFGYGLRIVFPLILIACFWFIESSTTLAVVTLVNMGFCYYFAITANNSLFVMLKKLSLTEELSKNAANALSINRLSCGVFAVLMSWVLLFINKDLSFITSFCILLLICGVFHIPASLALSKVNLENKYIEKEASKIQDILLAIKDRNYWIPLGITFNFYVFIGALTAYIFPYFLKAIQIKFIYLVIFELIIYFVTLFIANKWGDLYKKYGSRTVLNITLLGTMIAISFLFAKDYIAILIFAVLAWAGSAGIFASGIYVVQCSISIQNSCKLRPNIYLSSISLVGGIGVLLGNVAASGLFWFAQQQYPSLNDISAYRFIFASLYVPCLLMLLLNNWKINPVYPEAQNLTF